MAADSTEAPARSRPAATTLCQRGDRKRTRWCPAEAEVALQLYGSMAALRATWRRAGRCTERGVGHGPTPTSKQPFLAPGVKNNTFKSNLASLKLNPDARSKKLPVTMESGKRSADLEQRDAKIRKLTEEFESDTEHGECDAKIKERDRKITKLAAEIRRLTALLGERDVKLRKLTGELAKRDATIRIFTLELGQQNTKIGELTADVGECNRKLRRHAAEIAERDEKIRENEAEIRFLTELLGDRDLEIRNQDCVIRKLREELAELKYREAGNRVDEHRKEEEKIADVTLDAGTAHPRLLLSRDLRSVRWEFGPDAPPDGPERFDADPCVLGHQSFTSGHHSWTVDLTRGQFCAVGVTKESRPRKGPGAFTPERGVWAVQRWGFKTRALTDPPVLLDLPRVPKKIRICLNYERGEVAFFDAENRAPIFRFPPAAFAGERLRPWFWVEFGSVSLVRP
ncbi:zinc finger protein RFP-like isoform X2 [Columba livia]|uniref:zinc finger protein RFP-like isoform X2 n=1 Tax=Columba livia TaxID=8932 RepID=UPI0031B9EBC5